jgi:hypothetical protein
MEQVTAKPADSASRAARSEANLFMTRSLSWTMVTLTISIEDRQLTVLSRSNVEDAVPVKLMYMTRSTFVLRGASEADVIGPQLPNAPGMPFAGLKQRPISQWFTRQTDGPLPVRV